MCHVQFIDWCNPTTNMIELTTVIKLVNVP